MKQLIDLFNKKYGKQYGVIDDSFSNEDTYKIYKIIKTLCANDEEIMTALEKVKLPEPKTAKESIEKININVEGGGGNNNVPHYNETLIFEISGEDYGSFYNNSYFNMDTLNLDETKSYVGKNKSNMDSPEEFIHMFVYDKEADALMDEENSVYIYNHKSFNGTDFIEDENSAVLTYDMKPMNISEVNGYFKLYEVDKVELDNNCLSDDVSIKNSLTVGSRIGDIGKYSVAEGVGTVASGYGSHTEGNGTKASGHYSHAEGNYTTASGQYSHTEGNNTKASGQYSHAEGVTTTASGDASHAEGFYTIAKGYSQHVQGKCNIEDTTGKYAHIVGNGESETERSNAHTLDWEGNAWYAGKLTQEGTPTEDKDLATKKYVDEKTASIDTTINNTLPSNGLLTLTTDKIQTTTLAVPTDITLPTVTGYTEIHLFFEGSEGVTITTGTTTVRWKTSPTISTGNLYEIVFTYINDTIGWIGDCLSYSA